MKRKAKIIRFNDDRTRFVCVDVDNWKEILEFVSKDKSHKKKFNYIVQIILNNLKVTTQVIKRQK